MLHIALAIEMAAGGIAIRHGVAQYAKQYGPWRFTNIKTKPQLDVLLGLKVDGVIGQVWDERIFECLIGTPIKVVDVSNGRLTGPFPKVLLDNAGAGHRAADYLLGQGLKRFAVISGYWHSGFQLRAEAFRQRIEQRRGMTCQVIPSFRNSDDSDAAEDQWLQSWMAKLTRPVGLYAVSDVQAAKFLVAARSLGLRVPDDVAVLGTDNSTEMCDLTDPALSSIELNMRKVGYEAASLLEKLTQGMPPPVENPIIPAGSVVARASTDVLAVDDADVVAAVRYIRTYATRPISIGDVLKEVPVSRRMLERRFLKAMGRTMHDEIQRIRIEQAKQLLSDTDLSMLEIALATGFESQSYFGRRFAKLEGCTPARFRRQYRVR